jgi:hypothetical protein
MLLPEHCPYFTRNLWNVDRMHSSSIAESEQWGISANCSQISWISSVSRHAHRRRLKLLQPVKESSFRKVTNVDMALYSVIIFATNATRWSESVRRAMLDAGALSPVSHSRVRNADFLPSNLMVDGCWEERKGNGDRFGMY